MSITFLAVYQMFTTLVEFVAMKEFCMAGIFCADRRGPPPPGRMPQQGPPAYGGMDYGQGEQYTQSDNYGRAPERYSQPMPQVKYPGSHNGRESADPYGRPQESYQPPPQVTSPCPCVGRRHISG